MKLPLTEIITDHDNTPLTHGKDNHPATLKDLICFALTKYPKGDAVQKYHTATLATKISACMDKEYEIDKKDVELIKEIVADVYTLPMVTKRVWDLLGHQAAPSKAN